jgi:hypothetical protein
MITIDDRISAALQARAESLTEDQLSPATAPVGRRAREERARWTVPLLAAAMAGVIAVATVATVRANRSSGAGPAAPVTNSRPAPVAPAPTLSSASRPAPSQSGSAPSQSGSAPSQSGSAPSQSGSAPSQSGQPTVATFNLGYQPLWPFNSYPEAEASRLQGRGPQGWLQHPDQVALRFTNYYLGFTELDRITGSRLDKLGAHVGIGYRDPNGQLRTAAVLHLLRYGTAPGSPWEVVGSDDTTFSLEQPAYGSKVSSPMTIGGHITGVDENIVVQVLQRNDNGTDRATLARVPAGGENSPWTTGAVSFGQRGVLTIVASTGGHLQQVERFAIQGVHT